MTFFVVVEGGVVGDEVRNVVAVVGCVAARGDAEKDEKGGVERGAEDVRRRRPSLRVLEAHRQSRARATNPTSLLWNDAEDVLSRLGLAAAVKIVVAVLARHPCCSSRTPAVAGEGAQTRTSTKAAGPDFEAQTS